MWHPAVGHHLRLQPWDLADLNEWELLEVRNYMNTMIPDGT